jgi:hypothetical protein
MPFQTMSRFAIEADAEAEEQRDKLVERLKVSHPAFKAIAHCDYDDPCGLSACPLCGHRFRVDTLPVLAQLFNQPLDQLRFVTMYVCAADEGQLAEVNALTHLSARSNRSGLGRSESGSSTCTQLPSRSIKTVGRAFAGFYGNGRTKNFAKRADRKRGACSGTTRSVNSTVS